MNDLELQKAFASYLALISGAKTEEELQAYVQKLGKEGLQKAYQQFLQEMQKQQQPRIAKHGAKLEFIKKLQGLTCAPDEELKYYKVGGKFCKKCEKKQQEIQSAIPASPIQEAKTGTKMVKEFKKSIEAEKCGGKAKKMKHSCGAKVSKARKGKKLPTAAPASDRYAGGTYVPNVIAPTRGGGRANFEIVAANDGSFMNYPSMMTLHKNYNLSEPDSIITEAPAHNRFLEGTLVTRVGRKAVSGGKDWETMKRRWEEAKKATKK